MEYVDPEADPVSVAVYTVNQQGHPDTLVATLEPPGFFHAVLVGHLFRAPNDIVLAANTIYAVVVRPVTSGTTVRMVGTDAASGDLRGFDDWSIGDAFDIESGGSWEADSAGNALYMEIRGALRVGPSLAPTGLTATAVGRDRIDLSWTAPIDDGGSAINGYKIESSADGSAGWADLVANTGSAATIYSHTGLMPNTTLHYRVSAINGEGASDPSGAANATTDDYSAVTVSFGQAAYTVAEGAEQLVTVTLSADPERTVTIPLTVTPQGGAAPADYTVPTSVTFRCGGHIEVVHLRGHPGRR